MTNSDSYCLLQEDLLRELVIDRELHQYFVPRYPKSGTLKGNTKLHKTGVSYRAIVNGTTTLTERIAEVEVWELNEYETTSPTYILKTLPGTDFLNKLKEIK